MSPKAAANTPAPAVSSPDQLRNVVLVGHSGSGKTTLFHHLIAATTDGYRPSPEPPERSVSLSVATVPNDGTVLTMIDAPGYPDFVGELRAGLRAADAALFVVSAADGVDAATQMLWQECAAVGMPRMVVVTKLDVARADFEDTVAICQRVFGDGVMPVYLPLHGDDEAIIGNLGLLTQTVSDYSNPEGHEVYDARARQVQEAEDRHRELIEGKRADLMEAIIEESEDDTLLDRYLGGEEIDTKTVISDLLVAVARGSFHPVVPVSTQTGVGTQELLYLLAAAFPAPTRHPLPAVTTPDGEPLPPLQCDPEGPLVAEVVRTTTDPYVGRISLVRVFSGTLAPDAVVHVSGHLDRFASHELEGHDEHDDEERVGLLSSPLDDVLRPRERALAGEVVVVAKLGHAETSDTLSDKDRPALVEPWVLPEALLPVAIRSVSNADEDKLAGALQRLVAEDPTMRLERSAETHQVVLWTMGQAHVDLLMQRLEERYGVKVESEPLRVALRETFTTAAEGQGRNVKQSGGHGQYAVCQLTVEPLERGAGFEFVDKVVGGAVPRQFIPSVEKGVRAQLEKGVLAGYPVVDVRVTLHDGKAHSVDSSDMAFQTAGSLALRDAASPQTVTLLEPVDTVTVLVADEYVGPVMTDLQTRRGRVLASQPDDSGRTTIHAEVPQTEITRYAIDLRSVSHGTGSFTREPLRYEPLPAHLVTRYLREE
ncbi:MAG TPA: elongation factor G-like protein EF-G2 [Segeticoccus sp.]|uniref:elongation factor G-like protein EF-G2 n=1 Tax=Segeticoccus sp. TaxID=2706531 RepID=UPI002D80034E|nr:elongation factor G-like protein EF-G2 [Segeticoccus sp.]HET8601629.1 elongation factor G-like protein EF-G2 [Segeticoccus sp.]